MRVLLAPGGMYPEPGGVPVTTAAVSLHASAVAQALAAGWCSQRPEDRLTLLPVADGAAGSAAVFPPSMVAGRVVLQASGPLGQVREADLIRLSQREEGQTDGAAESSSGSRATWFLDAARLVALPADRDEAAREALEGTTFGLGQALAAALGRTAPGDVLVVGLARSAVHDGGAGLIDGLGGAAGATTAVEGRELVLALADGVALGGLSGVGQGLVAVTSLGAEQAQERDRAACAAAASLVTQLAERSGSGGPGRRVLPVVGADRSVPGTLSVTSWGSGAGGGAALVLQVLGARAVPGPRVMASLLGLDAAVSHNDLVVTAAGEVYDVLADSLTAVVGQAASDRALPVVLVTGRGLVPRGELAAAGVSATYSLEEAGAGTAGAWDGEDRQALRRRLEDMGARLARSWSR
ncbi:glycerate kinase [Actinomyces faecalis]|uniref:glycerate kinase n=1 Tax=Actinomyces faecalis TaxID=2722820 RepID=UPI002E2DFC90|nr:glycerate kinase [Actinomyces faecalis]